MNSKGALPALHSRDQAPFSKPSLDHIPRRYALCIADDPAVVFHDGISSREDRGRIARLQPSKRERHAREPRGKEIDAGKTMLQRCKLRALLGHTV